MIVEYKSNRLKKECEDHRIAQKEYGTNIGNKLIQRVGELIAATNLLDIKNIPAARLHRLEGKRSNQYAVDLIHPHRLIFKPIVNNDGDLNKLEIINLVRIEEVRDYHGKQKR